MQRGQVRAGARAVAPMLVGVVPFGLVAGAAPCRAGPRRRAPPSASRSIVFAGASQLAAIDVLGDGGSALVAALAAWTINLRMVLYSASLAPHLAEESLTNAARARVPPDRPGLRRLDHPVGRHRRSEGAGCPYYLGGALLLWGSWQLCTIVGALVGAVGARGRAARVRRPARLPRPAHPGAERPAGGRRRARRRLRRGGGRRARRRLAVAHGGGARRDHRRHARRPRPDRGGARRHRRSSTSPSTPARSRSRSEHDLDRHPARRGRDVPDAGVVPARRAPAGRGARGRAAGAASDPPGGARRHRGARAPATPTASSTCGSRSSPPASSPAWSAGARRAPCSPSWSA